MPSPVSRQLQESRDELKRSIESLQEDLTAEIGRAPGGRYILPLCALAIGVVAALALRGRLRSRPGWEGDPDDTHHEDDDEVAGA